MLKFIIFIGPPGCGKGTQASLLQEKTGYLHISTGEILRQEIQKETPLGLSAKRVIDQGGLVEDRLILDMVSSYFSGNKDARGFILDGVPRTIAQAEWFRGYVRREGFLIEKVFYFSVKNEILVKRLSGRFTCGQCGASYNRHFKMPKVDGVCDVCGHRDFIVRKDDDIAHVGHRISTYHEKTGPILPFYREEGLLVDIDAMQEIDDIHQEVISALKL